MTKTTDPSLRVTRVSRVIMHPFGIRARRHGGGRVCRVTPSCPADRIRYKTASSNLCCHYDIDSALFYHEKAREFHSRRLRRDIYLSSTITRNSTDESCCLGYRRQRWLSSARGFPMVVWQHPATLHRRERAKVKSPSRAMVRYATREH